MTTFANRKLLALNVFICLAINGMSAQTSKEEFFQQYRDRFKEVDVYQFLHDSCHIRLSREGSLKDIFDSGVRPYRFPGLERTSLEFTNSHVVFEDESGFQTSSLPAQWVNLEILNEGLLSTVKACSVPLTLEEAKSMMTKYLKHGERTPKELDEFLLAVEEDYTGFASSPSKWQNRFGFGWDSPHGPSYYVNLRETYNPYRPLAMNLILSWTDFREPIVMRTRYPGPIPPPTGYENVSMEAPEIYGPGTYLYDTKSPPPKKTRSNKHQKTKPAPQPEIKRSSGTELKNPSQEKSSWLPWIIAGVLLFGILALLLKTFIGKIKS